MELKTDTEFMKYIDRGLTGIDLPSVGDKFTTEKVLNVDGIRYVIDGGALLITEAMAESAKKGDILTAHIIDDKDNTVYLSDNNWYHINLLTKVKE